MEKTGNNNMTTPKESTQGSTRQRAGLEILGTHVSLTEEQYSIN